MSCDSDVIGVTGHMTLVQLPLQYLVSIPLLMLRPWAFVAMISQVSSHILQGWAWAYIVILQGWVGSIKKRPS